MSPITAIPFTINKLKVTSLKKCELEIIYAFGLVLFQKKTNMKLLFIQKNMGMYPENNCKDRDQLIICRVLAFFQLVEFLFKFFLNISSCGCFGFNCVQTYPNSCIKLLTFTWIHIQHHWVVKAKASKASEFWQIILQVSKCTKIGETIQKPAPPHQCITVG